LRGCAFCDPSGGGHLKVTTPVLFLDLVDVFTIIEVLHDLLAHQT